MQEHQREQARRVTERLHGLRARFGSVRGARDLDHGFRQVTGDRPRHMGERTFFVGEIFWVERSAWPQPRRLALPTHPDAGPFRPALVTRRQPAPWQPVELAPAMRFLSPAMRETELALLPAEPMAELREGTSFSLLRRRPVERARMGAHLDTLGPGDKETLARAVAALGDPGTAAGEEAPRRP